MNDGYIKVQYLLDFCANQRDHSISPNDIMRMPYVGWISVKDRLPEEHDSIFAKHTHLSKYIWEKESDNVNVMLNFQMGLGG